LAWPELRRIIRQKLAQAIELLSRRQKKAGEAVRQLGSEEKEESNHSDQSDTPAVEVPAVGGSRKRGRSTSGGISKVRIPSYASVLSDGGESSTNGSRKDEDDDEIMNETDLGSAGQSSEAPNVAMHTAETTPEPTTSPPASSSSSAAAINGECATAAEPVNGQRGISTVGLEEAVATGSSMDAAREMRDLEERINYCLHTFDEAPFTIQRIAELVMWPERHYRSVLKFLRAVERVIYVTSTVEEFPLTVDRPAMEQIDVAIESNGDARAESASLFSFLAGQEERISDGGGVQTKAVTMRPPSVSYARAAEARLSGSRKAGGLGAPAMTSPPPPPCLSGGPPPLDASDTGILHIAPTAAESGDAARARIGASAETAGIPVCIDQLDGTSGRVAVQAVHPTLTSPTIDKPETSAGSDDDDE
ncbi:hypothetical protein GGI04_005488, partial [Coemansia thaxteri]